MKIKCPQCGISGFLELRGSSGRVKHYAGYANGARVYSYHTVANEFLGINGNQSGIKTPSISREAAIGAFGGIWTRDHYLTNP